MTLATKAVRDGDHWVLNGAKDAIANAPIAKLIAVEAQDRQGPGAVPGAARHAGPHRHRAARAALVSRLLRTAFAEGRPPAGGSPARPRRRRRPRPRRPARPGAQPRHRPRRHEAALEYAQLRVQGGRRIVEHQAIGTKLAECALRLDIVRNTIWRAAWASDHPGAFADRSLPDLPLTTMAKVFTAETIYRVAKDAAECFGAMGVMRDMPLQKYIHDAMICLHTGDGNSDDKLRIAEALVGASPHARRCSLRNKGTHHGLFTQQRAAQLADDRAQVRQRGDQADHARPRRGARRARHLRLGHRREGQQARLPHAWRCRRNTAAKAPTT